MGTISDSELQLGPFLFNLAMTSEFWPEGHVK